MKVLPRFELTETFNKNNDFIIFRNNNKNKTIKRKTIKRKTIKKKTIKRKTSKKSFLSFFDK